MPGRSMTQIKFLSEILRVRNMQKPRLDSGNWDSAGEDGSGRKGSSLAVRHCSVRSNKTGTAAKTASNSDTQ